MQLLRRQFNIILHRQLSACLQIVPLACSCILIASFCIATHVVAVSQQQSGAHFSMQKLSYDHV